MASLYEQLKELREQDARELEELEAKIADAEYEYLTSESSQLGNVLKGYEGFMSSKETVKRKPRQPKLEERIFSLSSKKSAVTKEYEQQLLQEQTEQASPHSGVPKKCDSTGSRSEGAASKDAASESLTSEEACSEDAGGKSIRQKGKENGDSSMTHSFYGHLGKHSDNTIAPITSKMWFGSGVDRLTISDPLPMGGTLPSPDSRSTSSSGLKSVENVMNEITSKDIEEPTCGSLVGHMPADPQSPDFCVDDWFLPSNLPFKVKDQTKDSKKYMNTLKQIIAGEQSSQLKGDEPTYSSIEARPSVYKAKKYSDING